MRKNVVFSALLKKICYDYDQKHRLLMIENEQLRQCLVGINERLERLLLIHRSPTESLPDSSNDEESFQTREHIEFTGLFDGLTCFRADAPAVPCGE